MATHYSPNAVRRAACGRERPRARTSDTKRVTCRACLKSLPFRFRTVMERSYLTHAPDPCAECGAAPCLCTQPQED